MKSRSRSPGSVLTRWVAFSKVMASSGGAVLPRTACRACRPAAGVAGEGLGSGDRSGFMDLASGRPAENNPGGEVIGESLEAMLHVRRREEKVAGVERRPDSATCKRATPGNDD